MEFKEYKPRGGWWKHYRMKEKVETLEVSALLFFTYAIFATAIYYV